MLTLDISKTWLMWQFISLNGVSLTNIPQNKVKNRYEIKPLCSRNNQNSSSELKQNDIVDYSKDNLQNKRTGRELISPFRFWARGKGSGLVAWSERNERDKRFINNGRHAMCVKGNGRCCFSSCLRNNGSQWGQDYRFTRGWWWWGGGRLMLTHSVFYIQRASVLYQSVSRRIATFIVSQRESKQNQKWEFSGNIR